jgi:hypothetical protein
MRTAFSATVDVGGHLRPHLDDLELRLFPHARHLRDARLLED